MPLYRIDPPRDHQPMTEEEARARALAAAERVNLRHRIRQIAGSDLDGKIGSMDAAQLRDVLIGLGGSED